MASSDGSITRQIVRLKAGDEEAMRLLWQSHFERLTAYARQRMSGGGRRVSDEEDVAATALESLFRGAAANRFPNLNDREDLWSLLLVIAQRKVIGEARKQTRQKRGGGRVSGESIFGTVRDGDVAVGIDGLPDERPDPEYLAIIEEEREHLMGLLRDDLLRQIAVWKMQSFTNEEIAERLNTTCRTVERKLHLIRATWSLATAEEA